jgi:dCMP deaminase
MTLLKDLRIIVLPPPKPTRNVILIDIMGRPGWDEIWMNFATHLSQRSTCKRTSVGCVVVSSDNSAVLGLGYNGGAKGLNNDCISDEPGKCGHLHAEINALLKTNFRDAAYKKAYVTLSPCYNCAVALINAGIDEVIYRDEYRDMSGVALLSKAEVLVRQWPRTHQEDRYLKEKDTNPSGSVSP